MTTFVSKLAKIGALALSILAVTMAGSVSASTCGTYDTFTSGSPAYDFATQGPFPLSDSFTTFCDGASTLVDAFFNIHPSTTSVISLSNLSPNGVGEIAGEALAWYCTPSSTGALITGSVFCATETQSSIPQCGTANGVITSSQVDNLAYSEFCANGSVMTIIGGPNNGQTPLTGTAFIENPNSFITTYVDPLLSGGGDTLSWSCKQFNSATPGALVNCALTVQSNDGCGKYDITSPFYPSGGFYSGELEDLISSSASNLANFCRPGDELVQSSLDIVGGAYVWDCADVLANPANPPLSACTAEVKASPDAICEPLPNSYTNPQSAITSPSQIDETYCETDVFHPNASNDNPPLDATNIGGGGTSEWTWTCEGGYYNDTICTGTSYGFCGSSNGGTIWDFNNEPATNLCANGGVSNIGTGISQDPQYPFVWTWDCVGSTGDPATTQSCSANAQGAVCGTAADNPSAYLTASDPDLCNSGQPSNFALSTSLNPFYDYEWSWSCVGTQGNLSIDCRTGAEPAECGMADQASFETLTSNSPDLCVNGQEENFQANSSNDPAYDIERTWTCPGAATNNLLDSDCVAYKPAAPVSGLCNPITNNQSFYHADLVNYLQCTQGTPTAPILENPANGIWQYSCLAVFSGTDDLCTINAIVDGDCTSYSTPVSDKPSLLCDAGNPTAITSDSGFWTWGCEGTNGGNDSSCAAQCLNGDCVDSSVPDACDVPSPDLSACPDGNQPNLNVGETCNDADGCICGQVTILNGTECLSLIPTFPGALADMQIYEHMAEASTVARGEEISFTLYYRNNGPDTSTGTFIEYHFSELLEDFTASMLFTLSGTTASGSTTINYDKMLFAVGNVASGETGSITVTGKVKTVFGSNDLTNNAQITSWVADPNPLNNNKGASTIIKDHLTEFDGYIINPLLTMKSLIDRYEMIINWINSEHVFRDVLPGHDRYMHIMTANRMGLMVGYEHNQARMFGGKKCTSRVEGAIVAAKIMHMRGDETVYTRMYENTPFVDSNFNKHITNFINRGYRNGVIADEMIDTKDGYFYLNPHKPITHNELKEMMYRMYRIANEDPRVLEPLFVKGDECVLREELAYGMVHAMRGNPQVVMGFNDRFLKALYDKTQILSIRSRRDVIARVIAELDGMSAARLYKIGLDQETLVGILEASMRGEMYNYDYDTSSAEDFFYQVSDDKYEDYIADLFAGEY